MSVPLIQSQLKTLIDEASATVTYVGVAAPNALTSVAVWRIQKIVVSGTVTSILWADGNNKFDNIWDDRASLTYN